MIGIVVLAVVRLAPSLAPITLDDALSLAAKRNADLKVARADEQAAAVDARSSYQGVLPRLDLNATADYQNAWSLKASSVESPSLSPFVAQGTATLAWTVFDGLSSWHLISASRARQASAARQLDESTLRVAFEVTRRFYEVVKQQRALQVRREAAALSQELVERADALFPAGRGTKADTYNARVNLGNDEIAVRFQATALVRARTDLAVVLGLASDAGLEVVPPVTVSGSGLPDLAEPPPLPELLAKALKERPSVAAQKLAEQATEFEIARAEGAYWPVVGLQASFQAQSPSYAASGFDPYQFVATAGVTLAYNIYAGGETQAAVERAEVQARRARALLEQADQTVSAEVTFAREQVVSLAASVATAKEILDAADKALRFARDKLEAGVASQLEVRDATLKLAQAKLTLVNSVVDLVVARADLNRAVGGSL